MLKQRIPITLAAQKHPNSLGKSTSESHRILSLAESSALDRARSDIANRRVYASLIRSRGWHQTHTRHMSTHAHHGHQRGSGGRAVQKCRSAGSARYQVAKQTLGQRVQKYELASLMLGLWLVG